MESDISYDTPIIMLYVYVISTICSMHGIVDPEILKVCSNSNHEENKKKPAKLVKRKMLTLKEFSIEKFMI